MGKGLWALIFVTIIAIALNALLFKIKWFTFIGVFLGAVLFLTVALIAVSKFRNRGKPEKVKNSFIFPDGIANTMKNMDIGIQYESSVISVSLLMVGMVAFSIYLVFFMPVSTIFKIFYIFNVVCGLGLMGSMLVTYYQQLISYREATQSIVGFAKKQKDYEVQYPPEGEEYYA